LLDRRSANEPIQKRILEEGMKSRLSSTIWTLVILNGIVLFAVMGLAYSAGRQSGGVSLFDFAALPSGSSGSVLFALLLALGMAAFLAWKLGSAFLAPVQRLAEFSERFAAGDAKSRAEVSSDDELGYIAENLNRAVGRVSKANSNQEANESLQRSITDLLSVINQVARGDLSLRGKVTSDALGNVSDSINYMLDNFTKVLERVRKAAMEVTACSNNILVAADQMQAGATQQDQEITNTSSAVEELTVSMKQVSNNAEASAEAARRALDAAEQGNRAVRDTLEGMQRIRASVQATAKKIKSLGDRSLEISEIINVINDITEQTNLLALNAAIEAARAGEAGRGFAVVADEVRKLAEHSRSATKDIAALIKAIQAETNEAVVVMEEGTKEVESGATLADQAGRALDAISSVVRQSAELVQEISLASKQQVRGTEGVAHAMQIISSITRQTSQGTRGTVATVSQLVKLSDQLNEALAQFRAQSKQNATLAEADRLVPVGASR
jgi:methyl-accepting chemotaxis protein